MDHVYIVETGWDYEGAEAAEIVGVAASLKVARQIVRETHGKVDLARVEPWLWSARKPRGLIDWIAIRRVEVRK